MYRVGDNVLIYVPPKPGMSTKLQPRWQGPYIVVQCREGHIYRLKKADSFRKRILRHRDQLRPFYERPQKLNPPAQVPHPVNSNVPGLTTTPPPTRFATAILLLSRVAQRRGF